MEKYKIIKITTKNTEKEGALSFFEGERDLPFSIKRIYYIHHVPNHIKRGGHAHKKLRQILFCPYGSIEIHLTDGKNQFVILLDNPENGLVLYEGLWREMVWKKENSVLCVAASEYYDESDYIRNYKDYLSYIQEQTEREKIALELE